MVNDEEFDFNESIGQKVLELEAEKQKIERHLGYAKMIKLTGRFPVRPKEMGKVKFEEFQREAIEGWNIVDDPQGADYARLAETILSKTPEEWENSDLGCLFSGLESMINLDADILLAEYVLPKAIVKHKNLGADHSDIQLLVKLIYENQSLIGTAYGMKDNMTKKQFSRFYASTYLAGDVAKLKACDFTKAECEFIAEAVSIFGGYDSYEKLVEDELRYGREIKKDGEVL